MGVMNALRAVWRLVLVIVCAGCCVTANLVGVLRHKHDRTPAVVWHYNHNRFLHGWPFGFLERSTEMNWWTGVVPPNKPEIYATRLPFDRAAVVSFDWKALVADVFLTGVLGFLSIASVLRASFGDRSQHGRTSAVWAFLAVTTVIGCFLAVHRHFDWVFVFRFERELIPYHDLAISIVILIGLIHLPAACRRLKGTGALARK
jgi:hypothetical protein